MVGSIELHDALDAIVRCNAIPEAYRVAEQAGWYELFPGVIYKERTDMEITTAREILTQAAKDETYAGPMPEDDAVALKEAQDLVDMAEQAWTQNIRGPEVEAILRLANAGDNGSGGEQQQDGDGEEEVASESEAQVGEVPENWTKSEPWEGYGDDTVKDITEGVNFFIQENPDDIADILQHVRAYETSHKRRVRIIGHINAALERLGVAKYETDGEKEESETGNGISGQATEEKSGEESSEAESGDVGGEGDQELSRASETTPKSSDAKDEPVGEARTAGSEGGVSETEPQGQDQGDGSGEGASAYQKLLARVEQDLLNERVDVPKPPEEKAPELPWRWNEISDSDLRDFHMQYASLAYYKSYVYAREERVAMLCREAADEIHNALMVEVEKYDDHNKEKKVGLIEAEIASDPNVKRWRKLQRKHEQYAQSAKREMESYYKLVEALSRLESMRHNAWERSRR